MAREDQVLTTYMQRANQSAFVALVLPQVHEYAQRKEFPLNLMLEMRFLKASQMIMSNMYDEDPEAIYATMELVSAVNTKEFEEFSAKMAKYWMENYGSL